VYATSSTTPDSFAFPNFDGPKSATSVVASGDVKQPGVHILPHFEDFKSKVAYAGDLPFAERNTLLANAWTSCYPVHSNAWIYNTLVVEYLVELGWDPSGILSDHESFTLPPVYTLQNQSFLNSLERSSKRYPYASRAYHRISMKVVQLAKSANASRSSSQDAELLSIIRLALQGALTTSNKVEPSAAQSLAIIANKIQNFDIRQSLRSILMGTESVEQSIIVLLTRAAADYNVFTSAEQVLSCLPRKHLRSLVPSITVSLGIAVARSNRLPDKTHGHRLNAWFKMLEGLDRQSGPHKSSSKFLDEATAAVTKYVFRNKNPGRMRSHVLLHALTFQITQQTPYASHRDKMLQLIYDSAKLVCTHHEPLEFETILGLVFARMQREGLPHTPLVDMTVYVLTRYAEFSFVYRVLFMLEQRGLALQNASSIQSRVAKRIASLPRKTESMTDQAHQHYAFALRMCQGITDLLAKLIPSSSTANALSDAKKQVLRLQARREFAVILDRASSNHALPQIFANTTADISTSARTILIHQLAHLYSISTTRSHRETWRSIYYLYNYLQSYSLPIGPLFTKAVVRAAIIRPMMEHRFISARRLIWVCHLVARVEGEDVAKQVESHYWRWRGELIQHAKRAHDGAGGDTKAKAMVSRMKGLGLI
jgi:hypothetical protein